MTSKEIIYSKHSLIPVQPVPLPGFSWEFAGICLL